MSLDLGQEIGRYVVEAKLGSGGTALVYRVRHKTLGAAYALKLLTSPSEVVRERMAKEGRIQAMLSHPNVVRVVDTFDVEGSMVLLMDLVRGPPLDAVMVRHRFSTSECLAVIGGVLAGIEAAHELGLAHRDIKPENILLQASHTAVFAKVTDFGLAKGDFGGQVTRSTRVGVALGTPAYMAPEQVKDASKATEAADIWSVGAMLYELSTGKVAFENESLFETMNRIVRAEYTPPTEINPDIPPAITKAIARCLVTDPALRPTPAELAGILAEKPTPDCVQDVLPTELDVASTAATIAIGLAFATPAPAGRRSAQPLSSDPFGTLDEYVGDEESTPKTPRTPTRSEDTNTPGDHFAGPRNDFDDTTFEEPTLTAKMVVATAGIGAAALGWIVVLAVVLLAAIIAMSLFFT